MTKYSDQFEEVETPPFGKRFSQPDSTGRVSCVVCGQRGFAPINGNSPHSWAKAHRNHVICTCGQVVSATGIGIHRAQKARWGNPCPIVPLEESDGA